MGVSIKFIGNPKAFAQEVKKDFSSLREGVGSGIGEFVGRSLDEISKSGFVHVRQEATQVRPRARDASGRFLRDANSNAQGSRYSVSRFQYPEAPELNIFSRERRVLFAPTEKNPQAREVVFPGRKIFAAGKVVSRRGRLPADLSGMKLQFSSGSEKGIIAQFGNGRSVVNVEKRAGGYHAQFIPNPKNMLAWLGFEYGRGASGSMEVQLGDGSITSIKGKVGQRRIIMKGIVQALKLWNKAAQGKLDQYMKRKSKNAK